MQFLLQTYIFPILRLLTGGASGLRVAHVRAKMLEKNKDFAGEGPNPWAVMKLFPLGGAAPLGDDEALFRLKRPAGHFGFEWCIR